MKIIDSQLHCFYADTPERPWPAGAVSHQGPRFTIEQARELMDRHGVHGAVLVPASWTGWDNQYCLDAAIAQPDRFGVMGRFNFEAPDAPQQLRAWRQRGMLGVRFYMAAAPWTKLLEPEQDWVWAIAEETGLPVMAAIPGNVTGFEPLLQRHPGLRLIIDHAGRDPGGARDDAAWSDIDELLALNRFGNVSVKVSSLPCFTTQGYPFPNLHQPIRAIYDSFGPHRLHWGSDYTRLASTYDENIRLFTQALDFLGARDLDLIMGASLQAALDWES